MREITSGRTTRLRDHGDFGACAREKSLGCARGTRWGNARKSFDRNVRVRPPGRTSALRSIFVATTETN